MSSADRSKEMQRALEADGEKLRQLTGQDHGPWGTERADNRKLRPFAEVPMSADAREGFEQRPAHLVVMPQELHPDSKLLVQFFAEELARKLRAAEEKYGYAAHWLTDDWETECRRQLGAHLDKGDPVDVAIYAAFMWARGWPTRRPPTLRRPEPRRDRVTESASARDVSGGTK